MPGGDGDDNKEIDDVTANVQSLSLLSSGSSDDQSNSCDYSMCDDCIYEFNEYVYVYTKEVKPKSALIRSYSNHSEENKKEKNMKEEDMESDHDFMLIFISLCTLLSLLFLYGLGVTKFPSEKEPCFNSTDTDALKRAMNALNESLVGQDEAAIEILNAIRLFSDDTENYVTEVVVSGDVGTGKTYAFNLISSHIPLLFLDMAYILSHKETDDFLLEDLFTIECKTSIIVFDNIGLLNEENLKELIFLIDLVKAKLSERKQHALFFYLILNYEPSDNNNEFFIVEHWRSLKTIHFFHLTYNEVLECIQRKIRHASDFNEAKKYVLPFIEYKTVNALNVSKFGCRVVRFKVSSFYAEKDTSGAR